MTANQRRFQQLLDAALNLGMKCSDAKFYAQQALAREASVGEYRTVPQSAEALANGCP